MSAASSGSAPSALARSWRQLALPFAHAPLYAADFLDMPSNAAALAWLDRLTDWPQHRLALWGEEGCGKTHLLHLWARRSGATLLAAPVLPRQEIAPEGPLAIDDADTAPERPLLHLLNAAAESGLAVLLAGRTPPARWPVALPDLASRLRATAAVEIRPAEDALLAALLARLLAERQVAVAEPVQAWLLARLPRTPAVVREAAARLDRAALAAGGRVTRATAAAVLAGFTEIDPDETSASEATPASSAGPRLL